MMNTNKIFAESFLSVLGNKNDCYLDKDNILWKFVDGEFIGKRSVCTDDLRQCWMDDLRGEKIMYYSCGINADYKEVFK